METNESPTPPIWEDVNKNVGAILDHYLDIVGFNADSVSSVSSVGCGMFFEAKALQDKFPNAAIIGYEQDKRLSKAGNGIWKSDDVQVINGVVGQGLIPENSQDFIIIRNPDVHRNWDLAFKECKKALKKNGILVVTNYTDGEQDETLKGVTDLKIIKKEANPFKTKSIKDISYDNFVLVLQK